MRRPVDRHSAQLTTHSGQSALHPGLVVVLAMAAAVGVVFAMFASPRGCGVYTAKAGSGAIKCVE
jgi:hypothetical protein